jgi:hypothetical protein
LDRAVSVLFLVVRRKSDGAWLLYRRKTHPLRGRIGFPHASPASSAKTTDTARQTLLDKTGLDCPFSVVGHGYFRVFDGDDLESFTHFTMLSGEDSDGELVQNDKHAEYWWDTNPDFSAKEMLPNMQLLSEAYLRGKPFFLEETLRA